MHKAGTSSIVGVTLLVILGLGLPAAVGSAPAGEGRQGWHGETMPEGLDRGKTKGEYVWKKDGSIMVWVPPGAFQMGGTTGRPHEQPVHEVELDGFYIDKYEVSWKKWKASGLPYTNDVNVRVPIVNAPDWGIIDAHPVVNVDWHAAKRYTAWAGKRLPTEAEWEKAARGTDGREYPWGNEMPTFERAVWDDHPIAKVSDAPINCCKAGASPYGAINMAGNVAEWCEDVYDYHYYEKSPRKNPVNREKGDKRIIRGGAFQLEMSFMRTSFRYALLDVDRTPYIGFRTAVSGVVPEGRAGR